MHAHRDGQGPGQRVEAAIGALGQQVQQLAQFVAPGGGLPEQGEGVGQGPPAFAGAAQLGGEHEPLAALAFAEPPGSGGVGARGGGGGAQAIGIVEVEQARFERPHSRPTLRNPQQRKTAMPSQRLQLVVERHADGYVAYPLGITGVVVGQGDSYEAALEDVRSALAFHIETFGMESLMQEDPVEEVFLAETVLVG